LDISGFAGKGGLLKALAEGAEPRHAHHDHDTGQGDAIREREGTATGRNDRQSDAQLLRQFGTGAGEERAISISGLLGPRPAIVSPAEDDGSIPLANATGLVAGRNGSIEIHGVIGDGPHGSAGSATGDYDFFRVPATAGQVITIDVEADVQGSTLNSAVGIYDSAGNLLTANDGGSSHSSSADSLLRFVAPVTDTYSVVVFGSQPITTFDVLIDQLLFPFAAGFQADPFDASSGVGVQTEGAYQMFITLQTPQSILDGVEDDGAIPLANQTGLITGEHKTVLFRSVVGDGPFGSGGTGSGDFDFYRVDAAAGQRILVDVDTPIPFFIPGLVDLDPMVAIYDSLGRLLEQNDDNFRTFDSRLAFVTPAAGSYYVAVGSSTFPQPFFFPSDPFDSTSGGGVITEGSYDLTISLEDPADLDYYSFDLAAGDIIRATLDGGARSIELRGPDGTLLIRAFNELTGDPLPPAMQAGGELFLAQVVSTPGRYAVAVTDGAGSYDLNLQSFRPALEEQPVYSHQVVFVDFDGAVLDAEATFTFPGLNTNASLSPLAAFLGRWGLTAGDESAVIDAILAELTASLAHDVGGVVGQGSNGDFLITGRAGEFQIEVLNSRDHADPFGLYPNVCRVIVGGTAQEIGVDVFLGIAQYIDVGNLVTNDTGLVLLDSLSAPADEYAFSVNAIPLGPGATILDAIGVRVGELVNHELGHNFGNFHLDSFNDQLNVMDQLLRFEFLGPDGVLGTADDVPMRFAVDRYAPYEAFEGVQDALNTIAFGLSTGKRAGTYFDFVTGTLYVTGDIDDGHKDELDVKTAGSNLKVYINDELVLTRPAAGVTRVVLNGSSDRDDLDASHYDGPVTLMGRGGKDDLLGGRGDDLLLGGDGNDTLEGGAGRDVLIGGRGADRIKGDGGGDLLIGGFTAFDEDDAALLAIQAEWTSPRSYEARIANLRGEGTGPRLNGMYFLRTSGASATVFDDRDEDKLTGGSGRDWFFAHTSGPHRDKITDLLMLELVTPL
jgi:Ca2+-binding RTX toxin-like protein